MEHEYKKKINRAVRVENIIRVVYMEKYIDENNEFKVEKTVISERQTDCVVTELGSPRQSYEAEKIDKLIPDESTD
ncbi:MAG TPA: hypothetical protein DCZ71_04530 [Ruminococcus sp.]|nr:hypothetical protein [Ruminococcus sp.]